MAPPAHAGAALTRMADILPLPPAPAPHWQTLALFILAVAALLALWVWRHQRNPYRRLYRALRQDRITAREAAHRLARLRAQDPSLRARLDTLRFRARPPERQALERLLRSLLGGGSDAP